MKVQLIFNIEYMKKYNINDEFKKLITPDDYV